MQPDLSKTGGVTETMRIAALASAWKVTVNPHTSATGINMVASIHLLASVENPGWFEGDVARHNPFRDDVVGAPYRLDLEGCVHPVDGPGLGVTVDEAFLAAHPKSRAPATSDPPLRHERRQHAGNGGRDTLRNRCKTFFSLPLCESCASESPGSPLCCSWRTIWTG